MAVFLALLRSFLSYQKWSIYKVNDKKSSFFARHCIYRLIGGSIGFLRVFWVIILKFLATGVARAALEETFGLVEASTQKGYYNHHV